MKIGEHVYISAHSFIATASIGSHVHIGAHSVLENSVILKDRVKVLPGSVLAAGMVVPPNTVVGGRPARILGDVGEGWGLGDAGEEGWVEGGELRELIRGIR